MELFLAGRRRSALDQGERDALEAIISQVKVVPPRQYLVRAGDPLHHSTYVMRGTMARYMDDREGGRQLVALQLPGEFVDLHGFPMHRLDHDVATLTECEIAVVPHARLREIMEERPHLTRLLWFSTLLEAAMHREAIFRLGRLDARGRVGHLLSETNVRLQMIGHSDGRRFKLPLLQTDLAEACGITQIHTNRVIRMLREDGILEFRGGEVVIHDLERLHRLSEFDPSYLFAEDLAAAH